MSKRISIEARILEYFDSAPLEAARSLLSIVQHRFRSRPDFVAEPRRSASKPTTKRQKRIILPVNPPVTHNP